METTKIKAVRKIHGAGTLLSHGAHEYTLQSGKKSFSVKIWGQEGHYTADEVEAKKLDLNRA
jgi:hypothetical protein